MTQLHFSDDFSFEEKTILAATIKSNIDTLKIKDIDFEISIRKEELPKDFYGYTVPLGNNNKFGIGLNSKNDLHQLIMTLGHELIHVEQQLHHKLRYSNDGVFWKDAFVPAYIATSGNFYRHLPWEVEAHKWHEKLYDIAMKSVKK